MGKIKKNPHESTPGPQQAPDPLDNPVYTKIFLQALMDHMNSAVAVYEAVDNGEDFIFKDFNAAGLRFEKVKKEDVIGRRVTQVFPEETAFGLFAVFQRVWKTGEPEHHPVSLYQDNKLAGWRENYVYKLPSGEIATIYDDMTEQKKKEFELREINKNLHEMIYIASHDLQTPLISMEGYASELLENYREQLDENGIYCINRLKTNAQRMYDLVISLLDISRLNTQKNPVETFDPDKILREIVKDLSLTIEKAGAVISIQEMPPMRGDKLRLEGVFRRLLTNALTYGGKTIAVGFHDNTWFISDDGIGIPTDQLEKIFAPGERLKKIESEGAGMGLTFCRRVIDRHGGKIWAVSPGESKGATFYFTINIDSLGGFYGSD